MNSVLDDVTTTTTDYDLSASPGVTHDAGNSSWSGGLDTAWVRSSGCFPVNLTSRPLRDDSQDLLSNDVTLSLSRVKASVLIPALFFVGFPTNCLNMVVFFKHGLRQRINLCLFCLSAVDLTYITFAFFMYVEQIRPGAVGSPPVSERAVFNFIVDHHLLGLFGFGWASQFISAVISCERCFCVVWPLRSGTLLKTKTTGVALLFGVLLIAGGRFAITEKYRTVCLYDVASGRKWMQLQDSQYYVSNKRLVDVLDGTIYGLILPLTFCSISSVATAVTAVKLKRAAQWRQENSSASGSRLSARDIALTRMLIYLSLQYIVLNLPNVLFRVSLLFEPDLNSTGRYANLYFFMISIVEICAALSSSFNFLVYYCAGSKYRQTVHGFCRRVQQKKIASRTPNSNTASDGNPRSPAPSDNRI